MFDVIQKTMLMLSKKTPTSTKKYHGTIAAQKETLVIATKK